MQEKIACGVVGASGYTGEELVRLLGAHPAVDLRVLASRSLAGQRARALWGPAVPDLGFENPAVGELAGRAEVFFLALPHGVSAEYALPLLEAGRTVIDLSADFRLRDPAVYAETYGKAHAAPGWLGRAVYGLVEWNREALRGAALVACPGCYPTVVQLPLIPLLKEGLLGPGDLQVAAMSGISGAGKKAELMYSYCEREGNLGAYGLPRHRHVPEMEQELARHAGRPVRLSFVPHLAPLVRGMHATIWAEAAAGAGGESLQSALEDAYRDSPLVRVRPPAEGLPEVRRVARTAACELAVRWDARTGKVLLFSVIDNLGKGAAAQAVQCFNVRHGLGETIGLL